MTRKNIRVTKKIATPTKGKLGVGKTYKELMEEKIEAAREDGTSKKKASRFKKTAKKVAPKKKAAKKK